MGSILVVPFPAVPVEAIERLGDMLEDVFHRPIEPAAPVADIDFAFDPARDQYSSRALLADLLKRRRSGVERILGVTSLDLFIPILTFVFGEAQLDGTAAVVSTCRLENGFYGLPDDGEVLQERLEKEAIHELGHTWGLVHCQDTRCVMRSSTYVEEIDLKLGTFCFTCTQGLGRTGRR
jgi:archaemetzincin